MKTHPSATAGDAGDRPPLDPWRSLEHHTSAAFTLAGVLLVGSLVVPAGLGGVTDRGWVVGLVLAGLGVAALAGGLLGLARQVVGRRPWLAGTGAAAAGVAGIAGVGLLALVVVGFVLDVPPVAVMLPFQALAATMAAGSALGFLLVGLASWRAGRTKGPTAALLASGGLALLVPVGGVLLRVGGDVAPPTGAIIAPLVVPPVVALVVGLRLRSTPKQPGTPARE